LGSAIDKTNVKATDINVQIIVTFRSPSIALNVIVLLIASRNLLLFVATNTKNVARNPAKIESILNAPE
jgi:hypothetical protein